MLYYSNIHVKDVKNQKNAPILPVALLMGYFKISLNSSFMPIRFSAE